MVFILSYEQQYNTYSLFSLINRLDPLLRLATCQTSCCPLTVVFARNANRRFLCASRAKRIFLHTQFYNLHSISSSSSKPFPVNTSPSPPPSGQFLLFTPYAPAIPRHYLQKRRRHTVLRRHPLSFSQKKGSRNAQQHRA